MSRRWVVTGCGRSGTLFAARTLGAAGVRCGHEDVFKLDRSLPGPEWGDYDADSSWIAVPHLQKSVADRVALIVRHPLDVIRSWMQLDLLSEDPGVIDRQIQHIIYGFRPEVGHEKTQLDRVAMMWYQWNTAALPYADEVVKFKTLIEYPSALLDVFGVKNVISSDDDIGVINDLSSQKRWIPELDWSDIRPKLSRELRELAGSLEL